MKLLSTNDKIFFFERNFFTLDGLWMIKTEEETNWETALNIDLIVWKKLLKIIFQRLKEYLDIQSNNLIDFIKILTFRWSVEGWDYEILFPNKSQIEIIIKNCPYYAAMDRNPDRHEKIPLICRNVCIPLYESLVVGFSKDIKISRRKFKGLGDHNCNFILEQIDYSMPSRIILQKALNKAVDRKGKLFYFEKNFRTLDGLWIVEVENKLNFAIALKLDIVVWKELYEIIFRRVSKYLNIRGHSLKDLTQILSFIWNCEGISYEIIEKDEREIIINVKQCPYLEAMQRNPERQDNIVSVCKDICFSYLEPVIQNFNPKIILKRTKSKGTGDHICDFRFKLNE
ncbi:MAG: DUF6125 family protein [Promethearchaeota archaeon]